MLGIGKNMGIALLSITVIFAGLSFTIAQDFEESPVSDSGLVTGLMTLKVIDENGYVKDYRQSDNQIVQNGFTTLVQETFGAVGAGGVVDGGIGPSTGPVTHMGIGTGTGNTASGDTSITAEAGCDRQAATFTSTGATNTGSAPNVVATITVKAVATFSGGADASASCTTTAATLLTEAGMFNAAASGGEMFARNLFSSGVSTLGASDTLVITWTFTFTDS